MTPSDYGLIGGIAGSVLGLLGGIVGTYFSIRNTKGKKERAFVVRISCALWLVMLLVAVAAYLIPSPYKVFAMMPVWLGLPFLILYWNRKQKELREGEQTEQAAN